MKRVFLTVLVILGAVWFTPVSFVFGAIAGMETICLFDHCERDISKGDAPHRLFAVMVRLPSEQNKVVSVLLDELLLYLKTHPDASLTMLSSEGTTTNGAWKYTASSIGQDEQIISAHHYDSPAIDVRYRVSGFTIEPLSSRLISIGHGLTALFFGVLVASLIRFLSRKALARVRAQPA